MQIVHRVNAPSPRELSQSSHASPPMGARGEYFLFHDLPLHRGEGARSDGGRGGRVRGLSLIERPFGRARITPRCII